MKVTSRYERTIRRLRTSLEEVRRRISDASSQENQESASNQTNHLTSEPSVENDTSQDEEFFWPNPNQRNRYPHQPQTSLETLPRKRDSDQDDPNIPYKRARK